MAFSRTEVGRRSTRYWISWIAPGFLLAVWLIPVAIVIVGSFLRLNISEPKTYYSNYGFNHYRETLASSDFWWAALRTLKLTSLVVITSSVIGAIVGWALIGAYRLFARFALTLIIVPLFLPPVVSALMWYFQFNPQYGPLGYAVHSLTGHALLEPQMAFMAVAGIECWRLAPFFVLIMFVCGRSLEPSLRDTLVVHDCRFSVGVLALLLRRFRPILGIALFLGIAMVAKSFESIFVTTSGGPGSLTETLPILIHRTAFQRFELGLAACESVIYDVILVVCLGLLWNRVRANDN